MALRRSLLLAGLGKAPTPGVESTTKLDPEIFRMVQEDVAAAKEGGFDCESLFLDPSDSQAAVGVLKSKLQSKKFDGVLIGFGVRGTVELTSLFEDLVNGTCEAAPGIRFGFTRAPNDIFATAKRIFPA